MAVDAVAAPLGVKARAAYLQGVHRWIRHFSTHQSVNDI